MATVTVNNIPDDLYQRLKDAAHANRRSVNREIILCIEQAIASRKLDPDEFLVSVRRLREKTSNYKLPMQN